MSTKIKIPAGTTITISHDIFVDKNAVVAEENKLNPELEKKVKDLTGRLAKFIKKIENKRHKWNYEDLGLIGTFELRFDIYNGLDAEIVHIKPDSKAPKFVKNIINFIGEDTLLDLLYEKFYSNNGRKAFPELIKESEALSEELDWFTSNIGSYMAHDIIDDARDIVENYK